MTRLLRNGPRSRIARALRAFVDELRVRPIAEEVARAERRIIDRRRPLVGAADAFRGRQPFGRRNREGRDA